MLKSMFLLLRNVKNEADVCRTWDWELGFSRASSRGNLTRRSRKLLFSQMSSGICLVLAVPQRQTSSSCHLWGFLELALESGLTFGLVLWKHVSHGRMVELDTTNLSIFRCSIGKLRLPCPTSSLKLLYASSFNHLGTKSFRFQTTTTILLSDFCYQASYLIAVIYLYLFFQQPPSTARASFATRFCRPCSWFFQSLVDFSARSPLPSL